MKILKCEVCGSNNLVKHGEYFVCEYCGAKYTIEDARKLFVEGSVVIDHSEDLKNTLNNADLSFDQKNYANAEKLYTEALNYDSSNVKVIMYRALSTAWQANLTDDKIIGLNTAVKQGLGLAHEQYGDSEDFFDLCTDILPKIIEVTNAIEQMFLNRNLEIYNIYSPIRFTDHARYKSEIDSANNVLIEIVASCATELSNAYYYATNNVESFEKANDRYFNSLIAMMDTCLQFMNDINAEDNDLYIQLKENAIQKKAQFDNRSNK